MYLYRVLTLLFLFVSLIGQAQNDTTFITLTSHKKDPVSYRLPLEKEGDRYKIKEYYMDGQLKMEGYSLSKDTDIFDGNFIYYYPNGRKFEFGKYANGYRVGQWKSKYEDTDLTQYVANFYWDSIKATTTTVLFDRKGKVRQKTWHIWQEGKVPFDTMVCYKADGSEMPCEDLVKPPEPGYNVENFILDHIRYPEWARMRGESGKVWVTIIVNKDGSLEPVNCTGGARYFCDEAMRVVRKMPKWKPVLQYDDPVRAHVRLPVFFRHPWIRY